MNTCVQCLDYYFNYYYDCTLGVSSFQWAWCMKFLIRRLIYQERKTQINKHLTLTITAFILKRIKQHLPGSLWNTQCLMMSRSIRNWLAMLRSSYTGGTSVEYLGKTCILIQKSWNFQKIISVISRWSSDIASCFSGTSKVTEHATSWVSVDESKTK